MIRCANIPSLSFLEHGGMLFEVNELSRWLTVDQILAAIHEYTGNGRVSGWLVTATTGLNVSVSAGIGICSGVVGMSESSTLLNIPDDSTSYIYARFDGTEKLNIGEADPEYSPTDVVITSGTAWEDYCARIATVVTSGGVVSSVSMEDTISILGSLLDSGLDIVNAHVHNGVVSSLIDLSSNVTGVLDSSHIGSVDASLVSGLLTAPAFSNMSHKGLWYEPLDVERYPAYTQDYYTYTAMATGYGAGDLSWSPGTVPKVWRNGVVVNDSEYTYNQDNRTVTFSTAQNISSEIEIASKYTTYTASISITDRDGLSFLLYKNRKLITSGYTVVDNGDTTTFTFDSSQSYSDSFIVCVEGYYVSDIVDNYDHQEIDDYVSNRIAYGGLEETEAATEVILQSILAERHIACNDDIAGKYQNHGGGLVLFTPYVDTYDTAASTIPEPTAEKRFEIPPGTINDLYPEWYAGDHYRTKEDSGNLVLDISGAAVVFVIDKSVSMLTSDPTNLRLDACKSIASAIKSESPDSVFYVVGFGFGVYDYSNGWQDDIVTVNSQIDECTAVNTTTDYFWALEYAQSKFPLVPDTLCKFVILITDGVQTVSYDDADAEIAKIVGNSVSGTYTNSIFTVGIGDVYLPHLMSLSRGTDGVFYYCNTIAAINSLSSYLLYGDGNSNRLLVQSGYWIYEHDFGDTKRVISLSSINVCPSGCSVTLGYSYSIDGINWSEYTYDSVVGISARYWRFVILLTRTASAEPTVSEFSVQYVESTPYYLWFEESTCVEIPHNVHFSTIVNADACRVTMGMWSSGNKTWENCQSLVVLDQDLNPTLLRRGVAVTEYSDRFAIAFKIENMCENTMYLHDIGVLYNSRGNW